MSARGETGQPAGDRAQPSRAAPAEPARTERVNPTEFAILGLLADGPRSGYDIKKEVEERLAHFWSQSYGHIYPMLRRLHDRRLVTRSVERQQGRPDRKVYALTDAGRQALEAWFTEPPAPPLPRNELLLRVFLGRHSPPEHLLRDVRGYRAAALRTLAELRSVAERLEAEPDPHPDRLYWTLTLQYGIDVFQAISTWAETAVTALAERTGP